MSTPVEIAVKAVGTAQASRAIGQVESRASKLGSVLKGVAAGGAVAAGVALVKFGKASVDAASASQQSIGATRTVFGKWSDDVIRRSNRAADAVGLSANEYRELANVTGASLAATGLPIRKVTDLTGKLTKRAADMAATFGGPTSEAVAAVSSLLRGEADPIERYGVSIKQSDVSARLAAQGLEKLTGKALKQAEQQTRLKLLFDQTTKSAGAFARESDTLAGAQQRLDAKVENVQAKFGKLLLPVLTSGANLISREVVPAAEDLADWLAKNQDEIRDAGGAVKDGLLPPLKTLGGIVADVAGFVSDLPRPIQSMGVQAAAAALLLPKLTGALNAAKTATSGFVGSSATAISRMAAIKAAAGTAAGVGGVLLLSRGMQHAGTVAGGLQTTLGGVAAGFAVGGPIGAGVGGLAGLFQALSHRTTDTTEAARRLARQLQNVDPSKVAAESLKTLAGTLDQVTGAHTSATRAAALHKLEENGLIDTAQQYGISAREMVNAALGMGNGLRGVAPAIGGVRDQIRDLHREQVAIATDPRNFTDTGLSEEATKNYNALQKQKNALRANVAELRQMPGALKAMGRETRAAYLATQDLSALQGKLPKRIVTKIEATGITPTAKGVAEVAEKYGLVPKQIKPIIKALGIDVTVAQVKRVREQMEDTGRAKPDFGPARAAVDSFITDFGSKLTGAQGRAQTGGVGIGNALQSGIESGFAGAASQLATDAASAVNQAVAAARRAADAHSPSRKMKKVGRDMADGLIKGFDDGSAGVAKVSARLADLIESTFARRIRSARKRIDNAKKERHAVRALEQTETRRTKQLRHLDDALVRNGRNQDQVNKKLDAARGKLKSLVTTSKAYATSIRDAVVATGDLTTLGKDEAGTATTAGILDQLRDRLSAAQRFADLIGKLTKAGLNKTSLKQLLAAGVEGGLSTAEALQSGGADAIRQVNRLTGRLTEAGTGLGDKAAKTMHGAGIKAAQGLVNGLERKEKHLDRVARRLANTLANAVRRALKISSPSGVFRTIGEDTLRGLSIGLDDTHAKRDGRRLASSLVDGFADPKLSARVAFDQATGGGAPVNITLNVTAGMGADGSGIGRQVVNELDRYFASGGRRSPHWP